MLTRVMGVAALTAGTILALGAAPASAEVDTAQTIQVTADTATRPSGVCVGWGGAITVVTVYDPNNPGFKLATVGVPTVNSVKAC